MSVGRVGDVALLCPVLLFMLCSDFCCVFMSALRCYFGNLFSCKTESESSEMEIILSLLHSIWCVCSSCQCFGGIFILVSGHAPGSHGGTVQHIHAALCLSVGAKWDMQQVSQTAKSLQRVRRRTYGFYSVLEV